jgi:uncharacterized protein (TIGR03000 family)
MKTPSGRRTFNTPVIEPGQAYYYMVRAEVVLDGKTHSETKRVIVRAGQNTQVGFPELTALKANKSRPLATAAR